MGLPADASDEGFKIVVLKDPAPWASEEATCNSARNNTNGQVLELPHVPWLIASTGCRAKSLFTDVRGQLVPALQHWVRIEPRNEVNRNTPLADQKAQLVERSRDQFGLGLVLVSSSTGLRPD